VHLTALQMPGMAEMGLLTTTNPGLSIRWQNVVLPDACKPATTVTTGTFAPLIPARGAPLDPAGLRVRCSASAQGASPAQFIDAVNGTGSEQL